MFDDFNQINVSQDLISLSSFVSFTKSTAAWRREQEVEATILPAMQSNGILRLTRIAYGISQSDLKHI